jgi:DNA-binding GntR family transcriptional regulator
MPEFKSKKLLVYDVLKQRIITQIMKPGEPINEGVLSQELEISKTPIREAIQQLEKEGFIENIPGKGNFVSYISIQGLRELFEIREMLECEAIKRAAVKRDPQKLTEIRNSFVRASTFTFSSSSHSETSACWRFTAGCTITSPDIGTIFSATFMRGARRNHTESTWRS